MKYRPIIFFWYFIFSFCFTPNISSAEHVKMCTPATVGSAVMCLEYVAYTHPVLAVVGSTVGLAEVARYAYKAYKKRVREKREQNNTQETDADESPPAEVFLAERYYYEQRKQQLTKLRDEFLAVYRGITAIKELFHPHVSTFSSQFLQHLLKQHTPHSLLKISSADELQLSDERKSVLRKAREQEFELLEKDITELHALLVVHFNELIGHVQAAYNAYDEAAPAINYAIDVWKNNLNAITDSIASSAYEQGIIEEYLLNVIKQVTAELKLIVTYYQQNKHLTCLQQSSDIFERCDALNQDIQDSEQWTTKELARASNNLHIYEHYFAQRGIPTAGFKNQIKGAFNKNRSHKDAQALKNAQNNLSNMNNNSGGPNEPKKPRNDDDFANMYEVFKKAVIGKILKDAVEGTRFAYKGVSKIFRAVKDIVELGIQKGDWLYLDKMHGDHIEVFKKCGKVVRTILNMDGTVNAAKTAAAAGRRITEWIS